MSFFLEPPSLTLPLKGGGDDVASLSVYLRFRACAGPFITSPLEGEVGNVAACGDIAGRGVFESHFSGLSVCGEKSSAAAVPPSPTRGEGRSPLHRQARQATPRTRDAT